MEKREIKVFKISILSFLSFLISFLLFQFFVLPPASQEIKVELNPKEVISQSHTPKLLWIVNSENPFLCDLVIVNNSSNINNSEENLFEYPEKLIFKENLDQENYQLNLDEMLSYGEYLWQVRCFDAMSAEGISEIGKIKINLDPDILKYEPILKFHQDEDFYPIDIRTFVKYSSLWKFMENKRIKIIEENNLSLEKLIDYSKEHQNENLYLQFSQNIKEPDYEKAKNEYINLNQTEKKPTYYAYILEQQDKNTGKTYKIIEYWFFYAFNAWKSHGGGNDHEGDWEMVAVFLNKEKNLPEYVAYSAHHNIGKAFEPLEGKKGAFSLGSVRRRWEKIEKQDTHPIVYVALGSHANYAEWNNGEWIVFYPEKKVLKSDKLGEVEKIKNWKIFSINSIKNDIKFFNGYWGWMALSKKSKILGQSSPESPWQQLKFKNPIHWAGIDKIKNIYIKKSIIPKFKIKDLGVSLDFKTLSQEGNITIEKHYEILPKIDLKFIKPILGYWEIETNIPEKTFELEISFEYKPEDIIQLGIEEERLTILKFNEKLGRWIQIPSIVDKTLKMVKTIIDNFSLYGIGFIEKDYTDNINFTQSGIYFPNENKINMQFIIKTKSNDIKIYYPLRFIINTKKTNVEIKGNQWNNLGNGIYEKIIQNQGKFKQENINLEIYLPEKQCYELEYFVYGY